MGGYPRLQVSLLVCSCAVYCAFLLDPRGVHRTIPNLRASHAARVQCTGEASRLIFQQQRSTRTEGGDMLDHRVDIQRVTPTYRSLACFLLLLHTSMWPFLFTLPRHNGGRRVSDGWRKAGSFWRVITPLPRLVYYLLTMPYIRYRAPPEEGGRRSVRCGRRCMYQVLHRSLASDCCCLLKKNCLLLLRLTPIPVKLLYLCIQVAVQDN